MDGVHLEKENKTKTTFLIYLCPLSIMYISCLLDLGESAGISDWQVKNRDLPFFFVMVTNKRKSLSQVQSLGRIYGKINHLI